MSIAIVIFFALSSCVFVLLVAVLYSPSKISQEKTPGNENVEQKGMFDKAVFQGVSIEGEAYVVYDITHREVIAAKNETILVPLASITKVMTAVSSTMHNSKQDKVVITPKSIEDGYDLGLKKNQVWSLSELLKYVLVFSSNDGAEAIADSFGGKEKFIAQMNADSQALGLNFTFTDPAGRDLDGQIGGRGNALDAAKLFAIAHVKIPEILDATTKKRQTVTADNGKVRGIPNTNQHIENLPGAVASKTGYTDLAGGNLGVIVDLTIGRPVAIVVLGSTREGRFRDVSLLYNTLRSSIASSTSK